MTVAYTTRSHLLTPTHVLLITIHIDVNADVKLGAIMRSLFSNPSDREAGDKADDEDERLVSRYAEGTVRIIRIAILLFAENFSKFLILSITHPTCIYSSVHTDIKIYETCKYHIFAIFLSTSFNLIYLLMCHQIWWKMPASMRLWRTASHWTLS